jgi:gliding motility-associated-like protein
VFHEHCKSTTCSKYRSNAYTARTKHSYWYWCTVSNVSFTGATSAIGEFDATNTILAINGGVLISSGNAVDAVGPNNSGSSGTDLNQAGDALLTAIAGVTTFDAAILEFDFIPTSDTVKFNYCFGSEEYLEFVNAGVNDAFGFFISGPNPSGGNYVNHNIALIPGTTTPVTIDDVNNISNSAYYINNGDGSTAPFNGSNTYIQYDGYTVPLTAIAPVIPCQTYHIRLAIADGGDGVWDSGVFLEANSFTTNSIDVHISYTSQVDTVGIEGCNDVVLGFKIPNITPVNLPINFTLSGTATNITDYSLTPSNLVIPAGSDSVTLILSPIFDGITEGVETVIFDVQTSACSNDTFQLYIEDNDNLSITTSGDTTICDSGIVTLWANGSGGYQPFNYLWSTGDTSSQITPISNTTTIYYVTVTEQCGQTLIDTITVFTYDGYAEASPDTFVCEGTTVPLTVNNGSSFIWSTGETTQTINVTPHQTTTYYVTATGTCSGEDTVTVSIQPLPQIFLSTTQSILMAGESATITATGTTIYEWSSSPTDPSLFGQEYFPIITVSPERTTLYTVIGRDTILGCESSNSIRLNVEPTLYIPNSFSPNGDNINDKFQVFGLGILSYEIHIYNRWGELVYYSKDINEVWDGKAKGSILSGDIYIYKIFVSTSTRNNVHPYFGKILLLR